MLLQKEGDGCSIGEAADYLLSVLKNCTEKNNIQFLWNPPSGVCLAYRDDFLDHISRIARYGSIHESWIPNNQEFCFLMEEITQVLSVQGVHLPKEALEKEEIIRVCPLNKNTKNAEKLSNESSSLDVGDSNMRGRLQDSERALIELKAEVERLKLEANRLSDQSKKLLEQENEINYLKAEIDRLKTELAQGKSLSTLQKLIITMAVKGYGYKTEESKSPIPKQIEGDSIELGIEVTDDTVRKYLKQAAAHLPNLCSKPK